MSFMFQEKTWPELKEYADKNALIILPVGTVEEHSLYLPVDTDARIAQYLAAQIAELPSETFRMSMAIVTVGPIILAYPFFQKYFVKGLTIGAVKG